MSTADHMERPLPYGVLGEYTSATELLHAVRSARSTGYLRIDAFTPHPVEEISIALEHENHLPAIVLACGILGALTGIALQYYASVVDYPVRVAGKAPASWPAFVVVTFELTILFAALGAVIGMFALNGLPQPYHPVFNVPIFELATRNRFFLLLRSDDPLFDAVESARFLERLGALQVVEVPAS